MPDPHHLLQSEELLYQRHHGPARQFETEVQECSQWTQTARSDEISGGDISGYPRLLQPGPGHQADPGPALQPVQCRHPGLPPSCWLQYSGEQ